jgi:putative ABC transport system permease protein
MLQEIRFAFRRLTKSPAFVVIAVITLALAIGANTAVLSLVNALLIRPLPYRAPNQLVLLLQHFRTQNLERIPVSPPEFVDYQTRAGSFEKLGAFGYANFNLAGGDKPERIPGAVVTADVFPLLGVAPIKGRMFDSGECQPGHDDVVMISACLWQRRFNRNPQILGSKLVLNGKPFTIVGIMPASFNFPLQLFNIGSGGQFGERADIWQPLAFTDAQMKVRYSRSFAVIGRLKSGISVARAQAEIETINGQMRREHRENYSQDTSFGGDVLPLHELAVGGMRPALFILLGAVCLVLLIACANLATMLLARAAAREREMAIRVALGAGRLRLLKQMLTESVLLALLGGFAGILLSVWGIDLLKAIGAQTVPRLSEVNLDLRVLTMTFAVSVATGILFGLVPGLSSAKPELTESLKEGGRSSTEGRRRNRVRNALVVTEVALALVLLVGAGLLIKSFAKLQAVSPGFNSRNVLTMEITLPEAKYPSAPKASYLGTETTAVFFSEATRRIANLPGVEAAGCTTILPLSGSNSDSSFAIEGQVLGPKEPGPDEEIRVITPDYFRVLQTPLLKGRFFTVADNAGAPEVAIVNEALARKHFPNGDALGKRITFSDPTKPDVKWITIVGIVGNMRHRALELEPQPEYYTPHAQSPVREMIVAVRSSQDPRSLASSIRREVQAIDADQPIANSRTLDQVVAESVAPRRLSVVLLGIFAAIALLLAAVGTYGVISYLVVQRTHEIGVRMALGAQRRDVLGLVIGHALKLVAIGTVAGLVLAFFSTRALSALLYSVGAIDMATFAFVAIVLAVVALLASYVPAVRATRADPMIALSHNA